MYEEGLFTKKILLWLYKLKIIPNDLNIYYLSLTHRSFAHQINKNSRGNEQLEFLGDSVLSFIITTYLFENYGSLSEGKLAKIRSYLIKKSTLALYALEINLSEYILLSENEEMCEGRKKESIIADCFEAFMSAVFIDKGIDFTKKWFLDLFKPFVEESIKNQEIFDYKTYLQEIIQSRGLPLVKYKLASAEGPDHDKMFHSAAMLGDEIIGIGSGKSKKDSEQLAAKNAIDKYI
ncbi:MAG: ribonuclease III [Actinobacteria bacterium]|nr:ribonuclease III [Actinomycetota bacterium]MCL6087849.1 ribonuclease III [Actinomycetota bacterium]